MGEIEAGRIAIQKIVEIKMVFISTIVPMGFI